MSDQNGRYFRLRDTVIGALAALAAVGVIAGSAALAAKPRAKTYGHAAMANGSSKTPAPPGPGKNQTPQPGSNQPFLIAAQRLVDDGTITTTEGQALDRQIRAGGFDPRPLTSSGFTQTQLQAVEQALSNTKRALAPNVQ